jgi:putative PIN family toxin of toxin-antitoxin system
MRVVVDTNIIVSALLLPKSQPARIVDLWQEGRFTLLTAKQQIEEIMSVTRYPKIRDRINPTLTGRLINELRDLATLVDNLPVVDISPDPNDNYLLAISSGGLADYLVSGDKKDLLAIKKYSGTAIVSVADFLRQTQR